MWDRPDVDFIQSQDLPWMEIPGEEFAGRGLQRLLSLDPADGASTSLRRFHNPIRGRLTAGADVFVLEGTGTLNGTEIVRSCYAHLAPGAAVDWQPRSQTTIYFGSFGQATLVPDDAVDGQSIDVVDTDRLPWIAAGWADDLNTGAAMKWLRREGQGMVLLAAMLPGWRSDPEEAHEIYEESFKLEGDILMGRRGVMRAGAYFYRSPNIKHAPLYTRAGTMSLIRWSAPATTDFTTPPAGGDADSLIREIYPAHRAAALEPYR